MGISKQYTQKTNTQNVDMGNSGGTEDKGMEETMRRLEERAPGCFRNEKPKRAPQIEHIRDLEWGRWNTDKRPNGIRDAALTARNDQPRTRNKKRNNDENGQRGPRFDKQTNDRNNDATQRTGIRQFRPISARITTSARKGTRTRRWRNQ